MQCERLIKQIKAWYLHVQNETMAPARMISFIENHASQCDICQADPDLLEEIAKITEIILPESKIPKAVRLQQEQDDDIEDEEAVEEDDTDTEEEKDEEDDPLSLFDPDDEI
jgi:ribosomal protein L1